MDSLLKGRKGATLNLRKWFCTIILTFSSRLPQTIAVQSPYVLFQNYLYEFGRIWDKVKAQA